MEVARYNGSYVIPASGQDGHQTAPFQSPTSMQFMSPLKAESCLALCGCLTANLRPESGNYCRSPVLLTDDQSQGTKVASTVARDGKTQGISTLFQ